MTLKPLSSFQLVSSIFQDQGNKIDLILRIPKDIWKEKIKSIAHSPERFAKIEEIAPNANFEDPSLPKFRFFKLFRYSD